MVSWSATVVVIAVRNIISGKDIKLMKLWANRFYLYHVGPQGIPHREHE